MSNIEKIRQEIERRKKICEGIFERESDTYYQGKAVAYDETLAFIDSLPEEKPSEDLEEAANEYGRENVHYWYDEEIGDGAIYDDFEDLKVGFIAVAEWQRKHSPLPEDTVLFQKGVEEGKRLMMEEAVGGEIVKNVNNKLALHSRYVNLDKFHFGDKVKIIIVKQ